MFSPTNHVSLVGYANLRHLVLRPVNRRQYRFRRHEGDFMLSGYTTKYHKPTRSFDLLPFTIHLAARSSQLQIDAEFFHDFSREI